MRGANVMKIRLDMETCVNEIYNFKENDQLYKEALMQYQEALKTNKKFDIDSAVVRLETVAVDVTYKKAFHDGMRFILDTMTGKEVIEL